MPSKAIGVGVCPRCGRPGTVVIKAGNYIYVKHGNTWHYIGTINKINIDKILMNNNIPNTIHRKTMSRKKLRNTLLIIFSITILLSLSIIFIMSKVFNEKDGSTTNFILANAFNKCSIAYQENSVYIYTCNGTSSINASVQYVNKSYLEYFNLTTYNLTNGLNH